MSRKTPAIVLGFAASAVLAAAAFAQKMQAPSMPPDLARLAQSAHARMPESAQSRYLPEYTDSDESKLPPNSIWREWVYVGSPLTPNALNGGHAAFPEYHNVYIEPGSYAIYKKTGVFPDGTIFVKELQLTLGPAENPDGSITEPSGRGYFPGAFNGADVTVKDSKRYADTGGWGYFDFNHHEPKAPTAAVQPRSARFAISPVLRETRCGRSSTAYWMRSPFPRVVKRDEPNNSSIPRVTGNRGRTG
jgi:hypothetical protein